MTQHASSCAVHNEPAYPAGPCDCGAGNVDLLGDPLPERNPADAGRAFSYDPSRDYCAQLGMTFLDGWVKEPDEVFEAMGLSQGQVDKLMQQHIWQVHRLFTPTTYTFRQRVMLALHFLNPFAK